MKIYRYECSDGGGPYCTFEGRMREINAKIPVDNGFLYGCKSIQKLKEYFQEQQDIIANCQIYVYDVPDDETVENEKQVKFPKKYYRSKKLYEGK